MSAAQPGQGGVGHFNEQPPEYWISKMASVGYTLDEALTQRLQATPDEYAANMLAFRHEASRTMLRDVAAVTAR
jgi:hypothetical protein